jgi:hypothetical protein
MRHGFVQSRKHFFQTFASKSEIKRIGTQIDFGWPFQRAKVSYADLLKDAVAVPRFQHAAPRQIAKINNAGLAIIEPQKQLIILQRLNFGDLHNKKFTSNAISVERELTNYCNQGRAKAEPTKTNEESSEWDERDARQSREAAESEAGASRMKVGTQEKNAKSGNQETKKNSPETILDSWLPD